MAGVQWRAESHLPSDDSWLYHYLHLDLGQVTYFLGILVSSFVK